MLCSLWSIECFVCYVWNKMIIYYFVSAARKSGVCKRIALDRTLLINVVQWLLLAAIAPVLKKLNLNIHCLLIWRDSSLLSCKKKINDVLSLYLPQNRAASQQYYMPPQQGPWPPMGGPLQSPPPVSKDKLLYILEVIIFIFELESVQGDYSLSTIYVCNVIWDHKP